MQKRKIELIRNTTCTGCSACANVCPVGAVSMLEDERGFFKPQINLSKCISCGLCDKTCPILNPITQEAFEQKLYAMWASDGVRMKSSSGGAFTLLAEHIINNGGVVFGVAWQKDFSVGHIAAETLEQLEALKKSKYVQSYIGTTFRQVEGYLLQNRPVMFVGTGCQIGGLRSFIKNKNIDDTNLYLIDLWCYNVPPQKIFKRYINDHFGNSLKAFDFREKDGKIYTSYTFKYSPKNSEPVTIVHMVNYFKAFLGLLYECDACVKCRFQDKQRVGDVSLGDFWGIENYDQTWNDGKGTSMIQTNSIKGEKMIAAISSSCQRLQNVPITWIRENQGNGRVKNPNQKLFYDLLDNGIKFNKAVDMALEGKKYDIGMCCVQVYNNFGSGITNYALYKLLKDYNKNVLIITQPKSSEISPSNPVYFRYDPFPYDEKAKFYENKEEMKKLNNIIDKFVVGSDQMFNYYIYKCIDGFVKLDWVGDDHKKVSYATSFGMNKIWGSPEEISDFKRCIRRFDKVSVRESNAVDLVRDTFDIVADHVMDPVFLCDKKHYIDLITPFIDKLPKNKAFCYILDPDKPKELLLKELQNNGLDLYAVSDLANSQESLREKWDIPCESLEYNEEWLTSVYNSSYVIADSFHGLCFAIIFNKPFISVNSNRRGNERAVSLLKTIGYEHRIINPETEMDKLPGLLEEKIDFEKIHERLSEQINYSRNWFERFVIN